MVVDFRAPLQLSGESIDRVDTRNHVTEHDTCRVLTIDHGCRLVRHDGCTHFGSRLEFPAHATRGEVERIHGAVIAADVHGTKGNARLRTRANSARIVKGPFEAQLANVGAAEPRFGRGHEARVVVPPAGVQRQARRIECRTFPGAAWCHRIRRRSRQRAARQVFSDLDALSIA